jgi:hypothetical protein
MFPERTFSRVSDAPDTYRDQDGRSFVIELLVEGSSSSGGR